MTITSTSADGTTYHNTQQSLQVSAVVDLNNPNSLISDIFVVTVLDCLTVTITPYGPTTTSYDLDTGVTTTTHTAWSHDRSPCTGFTSLYARFSTNTT